jgi:hypothetical protein
MQRKRAGTVGVWLLAGTALVGAAADFWEQKDFTTWSNQEVEEMLTDSPWSKQVGSNAGGGLAKVTIAWSTALPIRQATVRQAIGLDGPIPPESQQELEMDPPYYVVTLSGLPPTLRWLATTVPAIEAETMLTREDKASIAVKSVRVFQNKQSQLISLEYFDIRVAYDLPQCDYSQEKLDRPCSLGLWDYRHRSVTGGL